MTAPLRIQPVLIVVDREDFHVDFWKMGTKKYVRKYRFACATGRVGRATPPGLYRVVAKNDKPDWLVPNDPDYPPDFQGQVVPFEDSRNPFAGGFIALDAPGYGLHGTKFDPKLGTRASHGCIRMATDDLVRLYKETPINCPVYIR